MCRRIEPVGGRQGGVALRIAGLARGHVDADADPGTVERLGAEHDVGPPAVEPALHGVTAPACSEGQTGARRHLPGDRVSRGRDLRSGRWRGGHGGRHRLGDQGWLGGRDSDRGRTHGGARRLHQLAEGRGADQGQGDQQQARLPPAAGDGAGDHAGQDRCPPVEQLVLQRAADVQHKQGVNPQRQQPVAALADQVGGLLCGGRQVGDPRHAGPMDDAIEQGRNLDTAGRDRQPAGQRHADHDHIEPPVHRPRQHPLPAVQARRLGRRRIDQPPSQADQAEQQHGDPDRLVQLEHREAFRGGLAAHPPGQADLQHDEQRDQPVQHDGHRGVAAGSGGVGHHGAPQAGATSSRTRPRRAGRCRRRHTGSDC